MTSLYITIALRIATALIETGYKLSEEIDFGSEAKGILDTILESLDVLRTGSLFFQLVTGGASEDEKTQAAQLLADARERQRARLEALGFDV